MLFYGSHLSTSSITALLLNIPLIAICLSLALCCIIYLIIQYLLFQTFSTSLNDVLLITKTTLLHPSHYQSLTLLNLRLFFMHFILSFLTLLCFPASLPPSSVLFNLLFSFLPLLLSVPLPIFFLSLSRLPLFSPAVCLLYSILPSKTFCYSSPFDFFHSSIYQYFSLHSHALRCRAPGLHFHKEEWQHVGRTDPLYMIR